MKKFLMLGLILTTTLSQAETIKDSIHSLSDGMIRFSNGRVAYLNELSPALEKNDFIEANLDDDSNLISFEKKILPRNVSLQNEWQPTPPPFEPTIIPSMEEANSIFNRSNPNYKRVSECSDRAHVWAFDEFKRSGSKSLKAFVLFTASYISRTRSKWWFHVAPMYKVQTASGVQDIVMDFRYTDRAMTIKEWTDQFVFSKRACKVTNRFSEFDVNPQTEDCYFMADSMYYRLPGELHDQELKGRYKTSSSDAEIKSAFRWAFTQSAE